MGVLTGIGGGVLRDLLADRMPIVLRADLYAIPAFAGSLVVVLTWEAGNFREWVLIPAAALCIVLRFLAIHYRWSAPRATDIWRRLAPALRCSPCGPVLGSAHGTPHP